ncbi:aspartate/glutamate racemase family protein [Aquamicrobium terrae]|uniref:Asp/Glu/hydantoin racemase n=1 Tax=Aquamicrobium terrae TaxID=1324945 RepID=A0ABV2N1H2_9HYPH
MNTAPSRRPIGMLILDTAFERIPGDAGNPRTWDFPVIYRTVRNASALRVIDGEAQGLVDAFIDAGRELVAEGCAAISTTCGFLALHQERLAEALPVPVATSSLLQVPMVERMLRPGEKVGVVTMDAARITKRHMTAVGVDHPVPMEGLPRDGMFWKMIAQDAPADPRLLLKEVLDAGERLLAREPAVGAIVLECTNMPPYAARLAQHLDRPVFDVVTLVKWLAGAVAPHDYLARGEA